MDSPRLDDCANNEKEKENKEETASVVSFFLCTNMCFDEKQVCAMNSQGLMMEFKSPCYIINHNICYGTTYETIQLGPCPRPPKEKLTYYKENYINETPDKNEEVNTYQEESVLQPKDLKSKDNNVKGNLKKTSD